MLSTCGLQKKEEPKLVPHHGAVDDPSLSCPMSFRIQYLEVWRNYKTHITVYEDSDPEWVPSDQLAPWVTLATHLERWTMTGSDVDGCLDLSNPKSADDFIPITDADYPSCMVFVALRRLGWEPVNRKCLHTRLMPHVKIMDGRVQLAFLLPMLNSIAIVFGALRQHTE